jgi:hypothetical protein
MASRPALAVVVRTVGERTTEACVERVRRQLPGVRLARVRASPFRRALQASYAQALRLGAAWTLILDADVILRAGAISRLLAVADAEPPSTFVVQGIVRDKLFGILRPAGNHLYRTEHLRRALDCLVDDGLSMRPESRTIDRVVAGGGYGYTQRDVLVGVHDFEQFFADVARKAFLHAFKHQRFLTRVWRRWRRAARSDMDFEVAMAAVQESFGHRALFTVDSRRLLSAVAARVESLALTEKPRLAAGSLDDEHVERLLKYGDSEPDVEVIQKVMFPPELWNRTFLAP